MKPFHPWSSLLMALLALGTVSFVSCKKDEAPKPPVVPPVPEFPKPEVNPNATPYVTRVLEYMPAVGQFTNKLPEYEDGDTQ